MNERFGDVVWRPSWPGMESCPGTGAAHPMEFDASWGHWDCASCPVGFPWEEVAAVMAYGARAHWLVQTHRN